MNVSYFISKRISQGQGEGFSKTLHKIAIISIGVGLAAAIISFLIMTGFQGKVKQKIASFSADLLVTKYTNNNSAEEPPFAFNLDFYNHPKKYDFIDHVQEFSHKVGLIKSDTEVLGVIFKGVGRSFDLTKFGENMTAGRFIHFEDSTWSTEVVLSEAIADKLRVKIGDDIIIHFFQKPPRFRKLKIVGLYETNLSDYFDGKIIIGDISMVQRLNDWDKNTAGGLQIYVKNKDVMDQAIDSIDEMIGPELLVEKISDKYGPVFEWLGLLGRQVKILLGIIIAVVCFNMISVILILVMERTQMVGVLKAVGASNRMIRMIFIHNGIRLILKGLVLGNVLGLGLCYLQFKFKFIKLNAHDYYMSYVPVSWDWQAVLFLNLLIFAVVTAVLLLPTAIVSRINPIKSIRFD